MSDTFAIMKDGTDVPDGGGALTTTLLVQLPAGLHQFISCSFKKLLSIDVSLIRISLIYD